MSYDLIVLSPHLDDAALSCGGAIHRATAAGRRVLVINVFTGDPPRDAELSPLARELHEAWQLGDDPLTIRRQEDERAMAILGAEARNWPLPDALYRTAADGRPLYSDLDRIFAPPEAEDAELEHDLARRLLELPRAATVLAPLAAGNHVDHWLVRRAALRALAPERIWQYEDFPYARSRRVLSRAFGRRHDWSRRVEPLSDEDVQARIDAIACYESQLGTAFKDRAQLERRVRRYVRRRGGERFWRRVR